MQYIFGPVPSRRLGFSLGIDVIPFKTCSFDCIYCQLGRTTNKTIERREYISKDKILDEFQKFMHREVEFDFVTFSGSGEPTLNSALGEMIRGIKSLSPAPVAVLTNSSLFDDEKVIKEIAEADVVLPSLDSAVQSTFERINRPYRGIKIGSIIEGLARLSKVYGAEMWLEIMLVRGFNDKDSEIEELEKAISEISPTKVQLNTVVRPPVEAYANPVSKDRVEEIASILGAEVIADFRRKVDQSVNVEIIELLKRRPCSIRDISERLGMHRNEVLKYIDSLEREGKIKKIKHEKENYYVAN